MKQPNQTKKDLPKAATTQEVDRDETSSKQQQASASPDLPRHTNVEVKQNPQSLPTFKNQVRDVPATTPGAKHQQGATGRYKAGPRFKDQVRGAPGELKQQPGLGTPSFGPQFKDQVRDTTDIEPQQQKQQQQQFEYIGPFFKDQAGPARVRDQQPQQQPQLQATVTESESENPSTAASDAADLIHAHVVQEEEPASSPGIAVEALTGGIFLNRRSILVLVALLLVAGLIVGSVCGGTDLCSSSPTEVVTVPTKGDWEFCSTSSQCNNGCCSSEYSDDGQLKCTPLDGGFRSDLCVSR